MEKKIILEGKKVTRYFGGIVALKEVDFAIRDKEIVGLIGPNGAGKTTLFNTISGLYPPTSGNILLRGKDITGFKLHRTSELGIKLTFQNARPFLDMTTLENVMVGALFGSGRSSNMDEAVTEALKYLELVGLEEKKHVLTSNLNVVERKMVGIAKALVGNPQILLIDELVAGLNPSEAVKAIMLIKRIRDELGVTIFWVEHVMRAVMAVAERIIVLHHGEKIAEATPKEVAENPRVIEAYLGERYMF